ncbi:hypothetical protein Psta_1130 [Pirellula staleyi DSM 6068]|uniref:Uncharacterized protein n=1 Tax=Pirellula staleyi (strain ATCC 27377 / DSM 6068 / ICPB 4128) TaxID=530564 RepID=D2R8Y5_PIRSD|nr:hypothetical protein Psta_1130 [Pirellula staleyi DSM 6068]
MSRKVNLSQIPRGLHKLPSMKFLHKLWYAKMMQTIFINANHHFENMHYNKSVRSFFPESPLVPAQQV